jgi:hypothetical protein
MINEIRLKITEFLNIVILDNKLIFLNMWHLVHFISGVIVMFFIFKLFKKMRGRLLKLWMFLGILIVYETIELFFVAGGSSLFMAETKLDLFWDLIFGFLGGLLVYFTYPKKKR